ncbi:MAG TPA: hypothetical protein VLB84_02635 [Bacteroidia bacterium]|nr:hypothetical protein [Bacteroidia bacterium]
MKVLYPNCIPVMGFKKIVFYDLERQRFNQFLKTDFFNMEEEKDCMEFDLKKVHKNGMKLLQDYQFLMPESGDHVISFMQPSQFYKWKSPALITNTVLELSQYNGLLEIEPFEHVMKLLERILCKHILLRINNYVSPELLKGLLQVVSLSSIQSIQLVLPFDKKYYTDDFGSFIMRQPKVKWLVFEKSPFKKNLENKIFFCTHSVKNSEKKSVEQFVTNLFLFSESQLHHTYFNRKLFIGSKGEIKNAPECAEIHGWIQDVEHTHELIKVIKTAAFQKLWYVIKERTEVCKDCEFRYMCIDNRIPLQRDNGYWYHEQACNYDPYSGLWKE